MLETDRFEQVQIESNDALWAWLEQNHMVSGSIWLVTFKKSAGEVYVGREAVLDALIAYGWIDGIRRKHDDPQRTMQLISPRGQQIWAQTYKTRAARLIQTRQMRPAGHMAIEKAKKSGKWNESHSVDALLVPQVLSDALKDAGVRDVFERFAPSYRRNVLRWLNAAKREETKAKRVDEIVKRTSAGEKVPQF